MKSENIVKKLKKDGYDVVYKRFRHWDNVPHVGLIDGDMAIAEHWCKNGTQGIRKDFKYQDVLWAIEYRGESVGALFEYLKRIK